MDQLDSMPWLTTQASAPSSFDWGGVTGGLFGLADTWLKADTAIKLQKAANGQGYLEGQRVRQGAGSALTIPTDLLLIGGVVALFFLMKD